MARLLLRYRDGGETKTHTVRAAHEQGLSEQLAARLMRDMGASTERFASPLNVANCTETYFSRFPEDMLFGANLDAYSQPFTGLSVAHPEPTPEGGHHALRWALGWAEAKKTDNAQTATLLVLPTSRTAPYTRYLSHPLVTKVGTIDSLATKSALKSATLHVDAKPYPTGRTFLLVSNAAGRAHVNSLRRALHTRTALDAPADPAQPSTPPSPMGT